MFFKKIIQAFSNKFVQKGVTYPAGRILCATVLCTNKIDSSAHCPGCADDKL